MLDQLGLALSDVYPTARLVDLDRDAAIAHAQCSPRPRRRQVKFRVGEMEYDLPPGPST